MDLAVLRSSRNLKSRVQATHRHFERVEAEASVRFSRQSRAKNCKALKVESKPTNIFKI